MKLKGILYQKITWPNTGMKSAPWVALEDGTHLRCHAPIPAAFFDERTVTGERTYYDLFIVDSYQELKD